MVEQPLFPVKTASVAGKRSVSAYHAMAWNDDADRIGAIRQSHSPHGCRPAEPFSEVAVADRFPRRDRPQKFPDVSLKNSSPGGHRK
jgi:hypothetical protein